MVLIPPSNTAMSSSVRDPPATARVALELLEALRTPKQSERRLVAVRSAVDRLRVLSVQLLASEKSAEENLDQLQIVELAVDAAKRVHSADSAVEIAVAAFAIHKSVDELESTSAGFDGDVKGNEWVESWQRDWHEAVDSADQAEALVNAAVKDLNGLYRAQRKRSLWARVADAAGVTARERVSAAEKSWANLRGILETARSDRTLVILSDELEVERVDRPLKGPMRGQWLGTSVTLIPTNEKVTADAFARQTREWFRLNHPNVLQLLGGSEQNVHSKLTRVFVCEPVEDASLTKFLERKAREWKSNPDNLSTRDVSKGSTPKFLWRILLETALGIKFLHQRRIVVGCVSSECVMIGLDGAARLAVFGRSSTSTRNSKATFETDIFWFGALVTETVTRWQKLMDVTSDEPEIEKFVELTLDGLQPPARPKQGFSDAEWGIVDAMCCLSPLQRTEMASVVHQLAHIVHPHHSHHHQPTQTVEEALDELQMLLTTTETHQTSELDMPRLVLERLLDIRAALLHWATSTRNLTKSRSSIRVPRICGSSSGAIQLDKIDTAKDETLQKAIANFKKVVGELYDFVHEATDLTDGDEGDNMLDLLCASRSRSADAIYAMHATLDQLLRNERLRSGAGKIHDEWKRRWNVQRRLHHEHGSHTEISLGGEDTIAQSPTELATSQSTNMMLDDPQMVPDWFTPPHEVLFDERRCLGQGSFGSALRGVWLDATVVIKRMNPSVRGVDQNEVFEREVGIWFTLRHPHVINLFGACHVGTERFFVCEYAAHGTLGSFLDGFQGSRRMEMAWEKCREAALGLRYLHARGVLHLDLKGDNILVTSDGCAKLTDFGLSTNLLGRLRQRTWTKKKIGAPRWKSPEILKGEPPCEASDVFALAMCIIEAVSGQLPWGNVMPDAAVAFHVKKGLSPNLGPGFSVAECSLIRAMSCPEQSKRLSLDKVVCALDAVVWRRRILKVQEAS